MTGGSLHNDLFERRKTLAVYWHNKASDLRGSAGAVWAVMHAPDAASTAETLGFPPGFSFGAACRPVYLMLCGMALELLLKAVLVARGVEPASTHDLVRLCGDARLALTNKQAALLTILSEAIVWEGRYPVPKQEHRFQQFSDITWEHLFDPVPSTSQLKIRRPNDNLSWSSFNALWALVFAAYQAEC